MTTAEEIRDQIRRNGYIEPIDVPRDGRPGSQPRPATNAPKSKTASGRFQMLNQFVDESARLVSTTAQTVWMVLYRNTRSDGLACVSHNQVAEWLGISRRTAIRSVAELVDAKLAQLITRGKSEGSTPSTYRVFGKPHT